MNSAHGFIARPQNSCTDERVGDYNRHVCIRIPFSRNMERRLYPRLLARLTLTSRERVMALNDPKCFIILRPIMSFRLFPSIVLLFLCVSWAYASPRLLTEPNSSRAVALESPSFLTQPFSLCPRSPLAIGVTRIMLFAEGIVKADTSQLLLIAKDSNDVFYTPTIEEINDLDNAPGVRSLVFSIDSSMSRGDLSLALYFNLEPSSPVVITLGKQTATSALSRSLQVLCDGNSLTAGLGHVSAEDAYPGQLSRILGDCSGNMSVKNLGNGGQTTLDMLARAPTQIDPLLDRKFDLNVVVAWEGTNQLKLGSSRDDAYQALVQYCQARRAAGFRVIILTILPRSNNDVPDSFAASRDYVNHALRENWQTFADGLVDVAADSRFNDVTDPTYYLDDGIHLNEFAYRIIAEKVVVAILGLRS